MANLAEGINLAAKYSGKVAERFKMQSLATGFTNRDYDWTGVKTLYVYSIPTVKLSDYGRNSAVLAAATSGNAGTSRYGALTDLKDTAQEMIVSQDKSFTFVIDKGDKMDSMNVRDAGKALRREIDEEIVPTQDKYTFNVIASSAKPSTAQGAIQTNNAYAAFLAGQTALDNAGVPMGGRIAAVNATTLAKLKQDPAFIMASDTGQKMKINGLVGEIDGVKIVKVPDNYLPHPMSAQEAGGTAVTEKCEFIITHPSVTVKAEKLADYKIHTDPPFISGNLVEGRVYYDAFVLDAKKDGVYAHYSAL